MSENIKTIQVPTIKELVSIVQAYNVAREHELRMMPQGGFPKEYKNTMMDGLYDCALLALQHLKPVLEANLNLEQRK